MSYKLHSIGDDMKRKYIIGLLLLLALFSAVVWSVETASRDQRKHELTAAPSAPASKWTVVSEGVPGDLRDFQFLAENNGWMVNENKLWKTTNGGRNWSEVSSSAPIKLLKGFSPQATMERVDFLSPSEGWLVEGSLLLHTTDGGASWAPANPENTLVRSVQFLDRNTGWFGGQLLRLPPSKDETESFHPVVYGTRDGGKNWRRLYEGAEDHYPLWDVWPISATDIWAVGASIIHSTDGGTTWSKAAISDWHGVSGIPVEVRFLDAKTGWIKTNQTNGGYLFTSDGGANWEQRPIPADVDFIDDVVYVNSREAWSVAGSIYRSTDGGKTWLDVSDGDYSAIEHVKQAGVLFAAGGAIAWYKIE